MTAQQSIRSHLVVGVAAVAILGFFIFGWGTLSEISGAVIAPGKLVVDSNVKKVQHPTGGVVGTLNVKDGDRVKKGDIVVRLDETQARTSLAIVTKALDEMDARQARLGGRARRRRQGHLPGRSPRSPTRSPKSCRR